MDFRRLFLVVAGFYAALAGLGVVVAVAAVRTIPWGLAAARIARDGPTIYDAGLPLLVVITAAGGLSYVVTTWWGKR